MFHFKLKTHLVMGEKASSQLGILIAERGFKKIGLIIDKNVGKHKQTKEAIQSLEDKDIVYQIFETEGVEPDYDYLDTFKIQFLDKGFDCLVGIGGGSILDLTKGIATLVTNPGEAISFRGFPKLKYYPLAVIAIPTTAGTGSEVTFNAVFVDNKNKKKLGINSEYNYPVLAIVDPLFTVDCPKSVTVSSGADALVHTLESYVHKNHTPISRMYSREAFYLLYNNLTRVLDEPSNVEIRNQLALGAYLAAIALMNAGSGPSGAFSYPLGVYHKVPHGYAGAIFLPWVTHFNVKKGYKDYHELYDLIEGSNKNLSWDQKNVEFANKITELMDRLGVPEAVGSYGLGEQDIEFLVDQYPLLKPAIDQNPVEITQEDARDIIKQSLKRTDYARI